MRSVSGHRFINGYSLSVILHLLLLLLGAVYVVRPKIHKTWHQFEWNLKEPSQVIANPGMKGISDYQSPQSNAPAMANDATSKSVPVAGGNENTPSRIIDLPIERPSFNGQADLNDAGRYRELDKRVLQAPGGSLAGGKYGFSSQMEAGGGDAYFLQQVNPRIAPNQDGEVLLEFRLTAKGTVIMNSLNVVSYTSTAYVDAVRKVLPEWKFGFNKAYDPKKIYRIRCRFITNE